MSKSPTSELVLTIDAGGSKTSAWLVAIGDQRPPETIGRGRSTGGNPHSVGFANATRAIGDAIERARLEAGRPSATIARAVLAVAGATDATTHNQLARWARDADLAHMVAVVPDVLPVLAAGTPRCCGVALIAGTGSSAFARGADGRTCLRGGWGYLLGDEGSGYALGRAAVRAALDEEELRLQPKALTVMLRQSMRVDSAKEMAAAIYRSSDARAALAALAPLVIQAAIQGDATAAALLNDAAHDLAELASRAANAVGLADGPFALAVTGGLLVGAPLLRERLGGELQKLGLECQMAVVDEPLQGCVRLADPRFDDVSVPWC